MTSFKTTTPRSARIGQEGHSTDKDWIHFTEKYRPPCMKFLDRHYPKYRFLKDDVYEDMVVMILDNPGFANRKPSVRFRTVLIKLLRKAMASAVRKLREESGERYARLMQPILPSETAFDCDRRRLQLIAVDFIRRDLLRDKIASEVARGDEAAINARIGRFRSFAPWVVIVLLIIGGCAVTRTVYVKEQDKAAAGN